RTGLDKAFYVAMKCKLMISTDTGLAHLRSIDGRLQIMIFGPTYVKKNIPLSDRCVVVTSSDMECMPCQGTTMFAKCKEHKCMDIDAALIVDIAKKLLAGEKIVAEPDAQSGMSKPNMLKTGKTPDNDEINVNKNFIEFGGK
ncbi:MAG: hypothetical protein H8D45_32695, partial [Bacteroidetes bacterium]|nr:hypothetical protein [Bacteroidota bacterium]